MNASKQVSLPKLMKSADSSTWVDST